MNPALISARKRLWLLAILFVLFGPSTGHAQVVTPTSCVDLNSASDTALQRIVEIGPARAARIMELRQQRAFQALEDLRQVPGISDGRLLQIKAQGLACVKSDVGSPAPSDSAASDSAAAPRVLEKQPRGCIDLNSASAVQLQRIVQIGPARAAQIIQLRSTRRFENLDDLSRVTGLSTSHLAAIRHEGLACVGTTEGTDNSSGNAGTAQGVWNRPHW